MLRVSPDSTVIVDHVGRPLDPRRGFCIVLSKMYLDVSVGIDKV